MNHPPGTMPAGGFAGSRDRGLECSSGPEVVSRCPCSHDESGLNWPSPSPCPGSFAIHGCDETDRSGRRPGRRAPACPARIPAHRSPVRRSTRRYGYPEATLMWTPWQRNRRGGDCGNHLLVTYDSCRFDSYVEARTPVMDEYVTPRRAWAQGTYTYA